MAVVHLLKLDKHKPLCGRANPHRMSTAPADVTCKRCRVLLASLQQEQNP